MDSGSRALSHIPNSHDQGVQFTAQESATILEVAGIRISKDGPGRAPDNIFIERLSRSVKYEDIYLKDDDTVPELDAGLGAYFRFYNEDRPHQSLGYQTPPRLIQAYVYHLILADSWSIEWGQAHPVSPEDGKKRDHGFH